MSKPNVGTSRSTPSYPIKYNVYVLWILAAILSLVSVKILLYLKQVQTVPSSLDDFRPLNSLSTVAGGLPSRGFDADASHLFTPSPEERAVVTTLYSESSASGVLALGYSLRAANISARRIVLYYPDRVAIRTLCYLQTNGWELHPVLHGSDGSEQYLRFQIWTLDKVGIKSVIFLTNDALVRQTFDELWSLPFVIAAVPQVNDDARGFSAEFDTSMLLLRPSSAIYSDMVIKLDGLKKTHTIGFAQFLNKYFAAQVVRLPQIYNADLVIKQHSPGLWAALTDRIRIVRYTVAKPFFEEQRKRAAESIWKTEMGWWQVMWQETFKEMQNRC